jgi:hypothetical protein
MPSATTAYLKIVLVAPKNARGITAALGVSRSITSQEGVVVTRAPSHIALRG